MGVISFLTAAGIGASAVRIHDRVQEKYDKPQVGDYVEESKAFINDCIKSGKKALRKAGVKMEKDYEKACEAYEEYAEQIEETLEPVEKKPKKAAPKKTTAKKAPAKKKATEKKDD